MHLAIIAISVVSALIGIAIGHYVGQTHTRKEVPPHRKGVYKKTWTWNTGHHSKTATILFLVEELERVGDYSKIKLLKAEPENTTISSGKLVWCKQALGNLVETADVTWQDSLQQQRTPEKKPEKRPITNEQLLQAVLNDNVRDM